MDLQSRLKHYRLSSAEYENIKQLLGREPEGVEWALFSALWSEHCSYKSSKVHLKKFYSQSKRVLQGFGENAGVIDLGQGEKIAFKMESHNHPSYIEPYQGAATGVGGILRDIFTMGARPVALANYLCFGEPSAERMPALVDGVVRGIGGYGNCVGVPTVTGQTEFHPSYNGNILVNALAVGYFGKDDPIVTSQAKGVGNYVVYVGAKTGKDGVHGASMASESFDEESESKKPTVQIGDPFLEKLLIESCIEVMKQDLVVAIQDMGAAGLTSSSFEMAAKGNVGFRIDLDKVPLRDSSVTPEEILLSESQERMLLICEPKKFEKVKAVFFQWDLDAEVIGEVLSERKVELYWNNEKISSIDPFLLTENAPLYERPFEKWTSPRKSSSPLTYEIKPEEISNWLLNVLSDVRGCSREWVYQQYDQRVGAATARDCSESVAAIRLKETGRALGLVLGCRPHVMRVDSALGGADALIYPALELAAKGFESLAITDCLNFGNPEKPELMSEFVAAVESLSEACKVFDTPVISGNVSLYNETLDKNVTSTPSVGVVGLKEEVNSIPSSNFTSEGQSVLLITCAQVHMNGYIHEVKSKTPGEFFGDLQFTELAQLAKNLRKAVESGTVTSSRVVGKFGLGYALARMSLDSVGFEGEGLPPKDLLNETLYQVVLVCDPKDEDELKSILQEGLNGKAEVKRIGTTKKDQFRWGDNLQVPLKSMQSAYHGGWRKNFESLA